MAVALPSAKVAAQLAIATGYFSAKDNANATTEYNKVSTMPAVTFNSV